MGDGGTLVRVGGDGTPDVFNQKGRGIMAVWIFASPQQRDDRLARLKGYRCPHCHHAGALNRHGYLKGYDENNFKQKAIRAMRVFCSDRGNASGCGRTFSVWIAQKVKRLFLDAQSLWQFLQNAAASGNRSKAFAELRSSMSHSAAYRIWKRFSKSQSAIRTALAAVCPPPKTLADRDCRSAAQATIAHLKEAFKDSASNPIAAYQAATQRFFI